MKTPSIPLILSTTGGYVDTASFLGLQGLFTAHVTGNFVTLGAALVFGTSGVLAKLMALPVFCATVALVRVAGLLLARRSIGELAPLLGAKAVLLVLGAALAIGLGPFPDGDKWPALLTGMTLVVAMAVQNAAHRLHLSSAPPTTLMTGNTTQIMIDAVDLLRGGAGEQRAQLAGRMSRMAGSVAAFAFGCAAAALLFHYVGDACLVVPPALALLAMRMAARAARLR